MNRGLVIFSAILVFCASSIQSSHEDHPPYNEVNTNNPKHSDQKVCIDNGCIQGKVETGNDKAYEAFYGIPFAVPPVGELRFKAPVSVSPWTSTWDATFPRSECAQIDFGTKLVSGSEDCLYLNVYRPVTINHNSKQKPLPVLVFIHGGSFKFLSASPLLFGPDYFMDTEEVIVVTIQYRLNVFGFLAADDVSCKGNFGLKDQNLALRWVHENIKAFGGNPHKITVMGQSAGAASVQYQMMSKRSNGLFKRAILMSGSALAPWALEKNPSTLFRTYAAVAGIPNAQTEKVSNVVEILKQRSMEELLEYHEQIPVLHPILSLFRPVVERKWNGAFITQDPEAIWASGAYQHRQFMTSLTGYEEGAFADLYFNQTVANALLADFENSVARALEIPKYALRPVLDYYFDGQPTQENVMNILKFRDRFLDYPMFETVNLYTKYGDLRDQPVDILHFNFTSTFSTSILSNPFLMPQMGASHMDDLLYLFRFTIFDQFFDRQEPENQMKDFLIRLMVDYVKYGKSRLNIAAPCRRRDMKRSFCEYLDIQRDYNRSPVQAHVTVKNEFDRGMVEVFKLVKQIIVAYDILKKRFGLKVGA